MVALLPEDRFRHYLEERGKRLTQERSLIVLEIFSGQRRFDVDDIVERLSKPRSGRRVSRATVYRTVSQLLNAGLIRHFETKNDRDIYEALD